MDVVTYKTIFSTAQCKFVVMLQAQTSVYFIRIFSDRQTQ